MNCNNCLQEIILGERFYEDEAEGTRYHVNCNEAAIDRRKRAELRVAELEAALKAAEAKVVTLLKVVEEHEVMARLMLGELSAQAKRLAESDTTAMHSLHENRGA